MNKKAPTETAIHSKFIRPAQAGTNSSQSNPPTQIHAEPFHRGHFTERGRPVKHGEAPIPNDIQSHKPNLPPVVTKAKAHTPALGRRMQQALEYAEILDVSNAHSSNGDAFPQHDRTATGAAVTRETPPDQFPSPAERWSHYRAAKGRTPQQQAVATQDHVEDVTSRTPRH